MVIITTLQWFHGMFGILRDGGRVAEELWFVVLVVHVCEGFLSTGAGAGNLTLLCSVCLSELFLSVTVITCAFRLLQFSLFDFVFNYAFSCQFPHKEREIYYALLEKKTCVELCWMINQICSNAMTNVRFVNVLICNLKQKWIIISKEYFLYYLVNERFMLLNT